MKFILLVLGVLSLIYGLLVLGTGSETGFWMIWEFISIFFFLWAWLVHKKFFVTHIKLGVYFHALIIIGLLILIAFSVKILSGFSEKGKPNLDYIIVLGAQVRQDGPSVVLKYRLDASVKYLNDNPNAVCIVSGGQGPNEPFTEAKGMADYLCQQGIAPERILLEDQSANTFENIGFSKAFIDFSENGVGIITNNFHMYRGLKIARDQGLENVCGIAADSTALYLPNNILREICSLIKVIIFG